MDDKVLELMKMLYKYAYEKGISENIEMDIVRKDIFNDNHIAASVPYGVRLINKLTQKVEIVKCLEEGKKVLDE